MNYFTLMARFLLIAYSILLLLLAIGQGITQGGIVHLILPACILIVLTTLWKHPVWSAAALMALCIGSVIFFKTYELVPTFLTISFPLMMASALFLVGSKVKDII